MYNGIASVVSVSVLTWGSVGLATGACSLPCKDPEEVAKVRADCVYLV